MSERSNWKRIFESDEDKTRIEEILKKIDQETNTFVNAEGSEFLKELLETVRNGALHGLKFLVTSRPDPKIVDLCKSFSSDAVCHLYDIAEQEANIDILTYLKSELPKLQNNPDLITLMQQANGLFIYASTAIKYIRPRKLTRKEQEIEMKKLIHVSTTKQFEYSTNATEQIDILYSQILSEVFVDLDFEHIQTRLKVLANILCAEERISGVIAAGLLNANDKQDMEECSQAFIEALHAVLYVKGDKVFWYHASFPDFIFTSKRFAFSPDAKRIASGSENCSVYIWNSFASAEPLQLDGHTAEVTSVAFSPDGNYIVSGSWDGSVRMWNSHTGAKLLQLNTYDDHVTSVEFSPDGNYIVFSSWYKAVCIWNPSIHAEILQLNRKIDIITSVAFSSDGTSIACGSSDKSVHIWNSSTGAKLLQLNGHTAEVTSVAFSPDGKYIVSGS
ncbi:hypothetical protein C0992_002220 [Termitomyces sp. T32_za158]|nr:hypothetical protein C0992_002220 [Termitomyces sp. T32_za158]